MSKDNYDIDNEDLLEDEDLSDIEIDENTTKEDIERMADEHVEREIRASQYRNRVRQEKIYGKSKYTKDGYGKGIFIGAFSAFMATILVIGTVLGVLYSKGMIRVGTQGELYVQETSSASGSGIGSDIEEKLNALDTILDRFYFDNVDEDTAANDIYKAYLDAYGDKYTVYYTPEEYKQLLVSTTGKFYGIGAVCQKAEDGSVLIVDPYEDCPAYEAGIRAGDHIIKVDGEDILEQDLSTIVAKMKGDKGTNVELEVVRGEEKITFVVTRAEVKINTVAYEMLDDNIGYLGISQFDTVTTQQFADALNDLSAQGMQSLVIDIRSNPGGVVSAVVDMLDMILPDGKIVYTEDKNGKQTVYNGKNSDELNIPLAVLVNGNSASASEIFAGAVQDYGIGEIIGTQTFGKGIVQTITPLTDGSAVKFTIAKYFTPKGQDIHGHGVTPDQIVDLTNEDTEDVQLNAAITYLMNKMVK